jgi:hypothetical protein
LVGFDTGRKQTKIIFHKWNEFRCQLHN